MIKLINYLPYGVKKEEYISKLSIHSMERKDDFTHICMNGGYSLSVKETPEEILAMPDIETTEKVIDWEQGRYDIAKMIFPLIYQYGERTDAFDYARETMTFTEALISELKKGQDNEN